jgi:putative membrane protein
MDPTFQQVSRTAKATPFLQTLQFVAPLALFIVSFGFIPVMGALAGVLAGALFLLFYSTWRKLTFWVSSETEKDRELVVESGIFIRRTKSLRISRLQSVDIHRPLVTRLTGFASVQVEVAGTGDSRVLLKYLTLADAQAFRNEIVRLASQSQLDAQTSPQASPQASPFTPEATPAPEDAQQDDLKDARSPRWEVGTALLIASLALTTSTYVLIAGAIFSVFLALVNGAGGITALVFTVVVSGASVITGFTMLFNFVLTKTDRGLSISHGLISTSSYTISPIRLQAIEISQPIAWRLFGWHRVSMNVAGIDTNQKNRGPRILIPVIHESELDTLFESLIPEWNINLTPQWTTANPRAKWRYPLQFRFIATHISPHVFTTRTGWLTRRVKIALHPRIQSLRVTQGPVQRRLRIATLHCDSVPGPIRISAPGISVHRASSMVVKELDLMHKTMSDTSSEKWISHS